MLYPERRSPYNTNLSELSELSRVKSCAYFFFAFVLRLVLALFFVLILGTILLLLFVMDIL